MTIGEKIKYCRNHSKITQAKLAELSGISLVSIKRYENDKMMPTLPQIKKLANALGIGALALTDTFFDSLQELETYGDLIRLLIIFRKNCLVQIDGNRDDNGHILPATATFKLNPIIGNFFCTTESNDTLAKDISFCLTDKKVLDNLLKWESAYNKYENLISNYKNSNDEKLIAALKENDEVLGKIELELQYDNRML
ncbi:MAG: helix-turn-helix domain-containing protein [Bacteroides sp.]|nr:helix-turn-helix domain-containing protein [Bacteroides sp.]